MYPNTSNHSKLHLNAIATRALLDKEFTAGILTNTREKKLEEYPLSSDLKKAILGIEAHSLHQFICQLHEILVP